MSVEETLELSEVESFSFLMKCLWDKEHVKREQMAILDTIVYKEGRPFRWIFSNNEGYVVKKRDQNITTAEVLRVFKQKSKVMKGSKHHSLINKIALVWYVDARNNMQSHLLDDVQLRSFMEDNIYECLAVQLYIGGFPLKGSGVFQHRFWLRVDNSARHETTELVSAAGPDLTIYKENTEKLTISDSQHAALKKLTKKVIKLLERSMNGTVASVVLQIAFSSSWTPFVVAAKSMLFWGADRRLALYRQASLFMCDPPQPPSDGSRGSVFLPHTIDQSNVHRHGMPLTLPYREANAKTPGKLAEGIDATTGENLFDVMMDAPNTEGKRHDHHHGEHGHRHGHGHSGENKEGDEDVTPKPSLDASLHSTLHEFGQELEMDHGRHYRMAEGAFDVKISTSHAIAPGLDSHGRHAALQGESTHKYELGNDVKRDSDGVPQPNFDKHPITGTFAQKARSKYNDDDLLFFEQKKSSAKGKNERFYNGAAQRPLGASDAGPHYPQDLGHHPQAGSAVGVESAPEGDMGVGRRGGQETVGGHFNPGKGSIVERNMRSHQSAAMSRLSTPNPGSSVNSATLNRLRTVMPGTKRGAIHSHPAYSQTESSRARLEFYASQLRHVETLPIDEMLKSRRAISAPHGVRRGRGGVAVDGPGITTTATRLTPGNGSSGKKQKHGLGGHGQAAGGQRGSGITRPAPLQSGTVCYGDYCFLREAESDGTISGAGGGGMTMNNAESALSSSGIQPTAASNPQEAPGIQTSKLHDPSYKGGVPHSKATTTTAPTPSTSTDMLDDQGGVDAGVSALEMDSVVEAGEGVVAGRGDGEGYGTNSNSSPSKAKNPFKHVDKVNPHDLQPPILPYQLPFRSILLLRSEENHLKCKLYEPWEFDSSVMESKAALDMKAQEYKIMDHNKRLLNLTQRHLRRIAYTCLSDVRKTVTSTPNAHTSGSGFSYQWQQLSVAYRKLIYADALSKTHPSRFYQTVPMCECCQFIYSMADGYREEIVFGGHAPPASSSPPHSPKRATKRNPDGSPGKHTNGIEEARQKGIQKREKADAIGSFRSSRYGNRLPTSLDGYGNVQNEEYDRMFDGFGYDASSGSDHSSGEGYDKKIINLEALTEKYSMREVDNEEKEAIAPDGRISAWVRMLTDGTEGGGSSSGGDRAGTAPVGASHTTTGGGQGSDNQSSKPNPMGPLAGQGVGNPLGQYRGLAAPVGYMLGQPAGDVGTRIIDENGNFIYQKKRSPADRHGSGSGGDGTSGAKSAKRPASANVKGSKKGIGRAEGIAFAKEGRAGSTSRPSTTGTNGRSRRGHNQPPANDGFGESKASSSGALHTLVDIDRYEFKSSKASQLFGSTDDSGGGSGGEGRPRSSNAATTRRPVPMPLSMPAAYGEQASKMASTSPAAMEDYMFTGLPGTDAPLIPLVAYHQGNLGVGMSSTTDGMNGIILPTYEGGGTSFEAMLLQTHTMAEAHKEGHRKYSRRRPASGSALGAISGRRREIMESKEKEAAKFEEVAARGYLGGMVPLTKHAEDVGKIYSEKQKKLKLGQKHTKK